MWTEEKTIERFLLYCKCSKNLTDKTLISYRSDLMLFRRWEQQNTSDEILQYVSFLLTTHHKTTTVKRYLASLSQYFRFCCRANPNANPMNEIDIKLKCEKILPKTIPVHEMKRLFRYLYRQEELPHTQFQTYQLKRDLALLDLISATGIRIGEAAAITLRDVDLKSHVILIHGKGRKERLIYLSCQDTVTHLKNWLAIRQSDDPFHDFLFLNRQNKGMSIHAIENIFRKYRDLAKINPNATPHYLRHTFATNYWRTAPIFAPSKKFSAIPAFRLRNAIPKSRRRKK